MKLREGLLLLMKLGWAGKDAALITTSLSLHRLLVQHSQFAGLDIHGLFTCGSMPRGTQETYPTVKGHKVPTNTAWSSSQVLEAAAGHTRIRGNQGGVGIGTRDPI